MIFICVTLLLALLGSINTADDLIVQLPYGKIRGHVRESSQGNPFYAFQEVPYAAPPVGVNRFQAPQDPIPWTGIKNTTKNKFICFQPNVSIRADLQMNEDCLFLNVYSPVKPGSEEKLPVWFFIHGGGYHSGSGADFDPVSLVDEQIVFVIISYRLGPFGFLSTVDDVIPGNAGLRDQHKALEWVHDNIGLFGGDNKRVTVNGASAGSLSICLHLLGPWENNKVLFHAAILESGDDLWHSRTIDNHREKAFEVGHALNKTFNSNDTKELLQVLLRATPEQILKVGGDPYPIIQKEGLFSYRPYKTLASGNFKKMPILMGFTSEESLWLGFQNFTEILVAVDRDPSLLVPEQFNMSKINRTIAGHQMWRLYTDNSTFMNNPGGYIRYRSDIIFVSPTCRHAQLASKYSNVYLYEFSFRGKLSNINFPIIKGTDRVAHGEDGAYIWDNGYNLSKYPPEDRIMSKRMGKLYTNFVKYHNPTPTVDPLLQNIIWPTVDPNQPANVQYLNLNKTFEVRSNPRQFQQLFQIIDRYITPNDVV